MFSRKSFLHLLAMAPFSSIAMKLNTLQNIAHQLTPTSKMPVLFLGHGSPMNAIEENQFVKEFRNIAHKIPVPQAILCVSAHWETAGTFVTAMAQPRTIHDFGGFPPQLFEVQYPAPGNPSLAKEIQDNVHYSNVQLDQDWGLDHGTWSVVKHLYPLANIPVLQLSLDFRKGPQYHYELSQELSSLRNKGVLIIGSGNMVHNLGKVSWKRLNEHFGFDWAIEAQERMKSYILEGHHDALINYDKQGLAFQLAIPSPEHFLPLLYVLGLQEKGERVGLFNDVPVAGALTMTSVIIES